MSFQLLKDLILNIEKRGTAMPHLNLEVLRKPVNTDMDIAAHTICVRTTMLSLYSLMKFLRFPSYKISITLLSFSNMSWKELPQSKCKTI